ncbi:unnamed protein product [Adineta steineri]|uniref:Homologous recombination OB-fold protein OB-fold domain-containing protein n=1 Tax=Adineta steineri TaxID=433720 RepID=A0A814I5J4_9BILA|nr:unnamed protein product [Adineta steineri]CAF1215714.1 unnamed protein product [Adineta steineri]
MSTSINNDDKEKDDDESINYDEIEEYLSNDNEIDTQSKITINSNERLITTQKSCITQVQNVSLSLEKSSMNNEEYSENDNNNNKSITSILNVKTSNIPGPVGLLPILKTNEDIRRLKEDKAARNTLPTNEDNSSVKRPKTSSDLFSLNIINYPSYAIALYQLQETFSCEPISIHTALVKARLGIKKRIPLMCAAVTHYDRQENTILLDKSGHIRATFIGDDELLDSFNIRVGHTLVLRNVAVFTSTRHRHHYVNIHLQNIIAIQDPLCDVFNMSLMNQDKPSKIILHSIENEISAYEDSSKINNETFQLFSQSDNEDNEQPPFKKKNIDLKPSNNSAFNHIKSNVSSSSSTTNKFKETFNPKQSVQPQKSVISTVNKVPSSAATITPSLSTSETNLLQMIEKPIDADFNPEDFADDDFFSTW